MVVVSGGPNTDPQVLLRAANSRLQGPKQRQKSSFDTFMGIALPSTLLISVFVAGPANVIMNYRAAKRIDRLEPKVLDQIKAGVLSANSAKVIQTVETACVTAGKVCLPQGKTEAGIYKVDMRDPSAFANNFKNAFDDDTKGQDMGREEALKTLSESLARLQKNYVKALSQ